MELRARLDRLDGTKAPAGEQIVHGYGSIPMVPFWEDWDVHWGYGVLTHGHMFPYRNFREERPDWQTRGASPRAGGVVLPEAISTRVPFCDPKLDLNPGIDFPRGTPCLSLSWSNQKMGILIMHQ